MSLEFLIEGDSIVLTDEKASLKDTGLLDNRDKLEVEIVIKVSIDVQGKGKDYSTYLVLCYSLPRGVTRFSHPADPAV